MFKLNAALLPSAAASIKEEGPAFSVSPAIYTPFADVLPALSVITPPFSSS